MTNILFYTANSHIGLLRKNNEDAVYAGSRLLALADGMGGHVGGEIASRSVISSLEYLDAEDSYENNASKKLQTAVENANNRLATLTTEHPELFGMGTTLTALLFTGNKAYISHIGDSRAYLYRDNLSLLTKDDTFIQLLKDTGQISAEEIEDHPQKSILLKACTGEPVSSQQTVIDLKTNDIILLCSDGLTDVVPEEHIADILAHTPIAETSQALIDAALANSGCDNISVIVAQVQRGANPIDKPIIAGSLTEPSPEVLKELHRETVSTQRSWFTRITRKYPKVLLLGLLVLLLILLVAGVWIGKNNYYLSNKDEKLHIYQGFSLNNDLFHTTYLDLCTVSDISDDHITVTLKEPNVAHCDDLNITQLSPSTQQAIKQLPQLNSLDEVKKQVHNLLNHSSYPCPPSHNVHHPHKEYPDDAHHEKRTNNIPVQSRRLHQIPAKNFTCTLEPR